MKSLLLITSVLLLTSCGNPEAYIISNPTPQYDDSAIKSEQVIQSARITAYGIRISTLENRVDALNSRLDETIINFNSSINNLNTELDTLELTVNNNYNLLNNALTQLSLTKLTPMKICSSNEYLLKNNSGVYAVFMVSNNYGTYFGKLSENVNYTTTDVIRSNFKIVNSSIVCL